MPPNSNKTKDKTKSKGKRKRGGGASAPSTNKLVNKFPPEIITKLSEAWDNLAGGVGGKKDGSESALPTKQVKKMMQQTLGLLVESNELPSSRKKDNNMIQKQEYMATAAKKMVQKEKALQAFQLFDTGGKGLVVLEDLERIVSELGEEELTREELEEMIGEVDQSGEGMLTSEDFIKLAKAVNL